MGGESSRLDGFGQGDFNVKMINNNRKSNPALSNEFNIGLKNICANNSNSNLRNASNPTSNKVSSYINQYLEDE